MLCFYSNFRFTAKLREWYSRSLDYAVHLISFCYNINEKVKKNILCPGHCLCGVCSLPASVWAFLWGLHFPPASQRWAGRQTGVPKLSQSWWIGCDALWDGNTSFSGWGSFCLSPSALGQGRGSSPCDSKLELAARKIVVLLFYIINLTCTCSSDLFQYLIFEGFGTLFRSLVMLLWPGICCSNLSSIYNN